MNSPAREVNVLPRLNRVLLYVADVDAIVAFYTTYFELVAHRDEGDRIVELVDPAGGTRLMVHKAGKAQRTGQSTVKLVFEVEDVEAFRDICAGKGLDFGPIHKADGYIFCNARDPAGNPISISGRAFRDK